MSKAGDRYDVISGNIWSYAHRGDLTGIKAALARGVDVNMKNTVGWTPAHAAAAGGHCKALRILARAGADLSLVDNGGNEASHEAAKNGHAKALEMLWRELGADITRVRLSQAKGPAVRELIVTALRRAAVVDKGTGADTLAKIPVAVGYARKQAKSTAFFGPRRTPISCKIKKKILKEKRARRQQQTPPVCATESNNNDLVCVGRIAKPTIETLDDETMGYGKGYASVVQQVKRNFRNTRKQRRHRHMASQAQEFRIEVPHGHEPLLNELPIGSGDDGEADSSHEEEYINPGICSETRSGSAFAILSMDGSDSDYEP